MAIPEEPLRLDVGVNDITLDEAVIFSPRGFGVFEFRAFLLAHSKTWTPEQIGKITIGEMKEVATMLDGAFAKAAAPLVNVTPSENGQGTTQTTPPPG